MKSPTQSGGDLPIWQGLAALAVGLLLILFVLLVVTEPVRERLSDRYVVRGNQLLAAQDFDGAIREYGLALLYNPDNGTAKQHRQAAEDAPTDIALLRNFYAEQNVSSVSDKLSAALRDFNHPKDALIEGVRLYQAKDYVYARYPLEQAVKLDPEYGEAWHYLGLTYDELAKQRSDYKKKAEEAFAKRDILLPSFVEKR